MNHFILSIFHNWRDLDVRCNPLFRFISIRAISKKKYQENNGDPRALYTINSITSEPILNIMSFTGRFFCLLQIKALVKVTFTLFPAERVRRTHPTSWTSAHQQVRSYSFKLEQWGPNPSLPSNQNLNAWTGNVGRRGSLQLWQFLVNLLDDPANAACICWTGRGMEFKLVEPEEVSIIFQI